MTGVDVSLYRRIKKGLHETTVWPEDRREWREASHKNKTVKKEKKNEKNDKGKRQS